MSNHSRVISWSKLFFIINLCKQGNIDILFWRIKPNSIRHTLKIFCIGVIGVQEAVPLENVLINHWDQTTEIRSPTQFSLSSLTPLSSDAGWYCHLSPCHAFMKPNHRGDCFPQATALITISVIHSVMITNLLDCRTAAHLRLLGLTEQPWFLTPADKRKDWDLKESIFSSYILACDRVCLSVYSGCKGQSRGESHYKIKVLQRMKMWPIVCQYACCAPMLEERRDTESRELCLWTYLVVFSLHYFFC